MREINNREITDAMITTTDQMDRAGLTKTMISEDVTFVYDVIDRIDASLLQYEFKLADVVELTNLSSIIGNLIRHGIVEASNGRFVNNIPHKYPDMLANSPDAEDIEFKISLENNKPKVHLPRTGNYLTFRYVLGDSDGNFEKGKKNRKNVPWIWESRFGLLAEGDFTVSNTLGDSGKTATINKSGWDKMKVIFLDECFKP